MLHVNFVLHLPPWSLQAFAEVAKSLETGEGCGRYGRQTEDYFVFLCVKDAFRGS